MDIDSNIQIRPASIDNKEFILSLVPRLVEFGPSTWRNGNQMTVIDQQVLSDKLSKPQPGTAIFVAQDSSGLPLGFIDLQTGTDYYNHEPHGHIANIIIAREGVGCGIGRLLMEKAEAWARSQGYS
jgi:GNAT superfamily N-acetyltransferase